MHDALIVCKLFLVICMETLIYHSSTQFSGHTVKREVGEETGSESSSDIDSRIQARLLSALGSWLMQAVEPLVQTALLLGWFLLPPSRTNKVEARRVADSLDLIYNDFLLARAM